MNIYLDTSHLQKWSHETLDEDELSKLNQLRDSGNHKFVLSIAHICDITERSNSQKGIDVAKFLDTLPVKWIKNPDEIVHDEFRQAINFYRDHIEKSIVPFVDDLVSTLNPKSRADLTLWGGYKGQSIEKIINDLFCVNFKDHPTILTLDHIKTWSHQIATLLAKSTNYELDIHENFRRVLHNYIDQFVLHDDIARVVNTGKLCSPNDEFVEWAMKCPNLFPSLYCTYYSQHVLHKNPGMKWKKSHFYDLFHLAALPYVDCLSVDRQMYDVVQNALKQNMDINLTKHANKLITDIKSIDF